VSTARVLGGGAPASPILPIDTTCSRADVYLSYPLGRVDPTSFATLRALLCVSMAAHVACRFTANRNVAMSDSERTRLLEQLRGILGARAASTVADAFPDFSWREVVLKPETESLAESVSLLRHEVQFVRDDLQSLRADVSLFASTTASEISRLDDSIGFLRSTTFDLRHDVHEVRSESRAVRSDLNDVKIALVELRADLTGQIADLRTETTGQFADLRTDLTSQFTGQIADLRTETTGQFADLRTDLTEHTKEIAVLRADLQAESATIRQELAERIHRDVSSQTRTLLISFGTLLFGSITLMFLMLRAFAP